MNPREALQRAAGVLRHPIGQNAFALSWVQVATFVVPLLTLPYLSRTLGTEAFGLVLFAQGFSMVLGIVIDYGFGATAARDAAAARHDADALSALVARVLGARVLLCVGSLMAALVALLTVSKLRENPELLALAWIGAVATGLSPGWLFVGLERLKLPSLVQLGSRVAGAGLTFVLVHNPGDTWVVLALYAGGALLSTGLTTIMQYRLLAWRPPQLRAGLRTLREASIYFAGIGAIGLYSSANVVILGLFVSSTDVAHFGAAERLVRATLQVVGPIAVAVFPRMAYLLSQGQRERAVRLARISIAVLGGVGSLAAVVLAVAAPRIIRLVYGGGFEDSVDLLRVLVLIVPLISVVSTLAGGWMLALRMDRAIVLCAVTAGLTNLVLAVLLVPLVGPIGMACSVVAAEVVALGGCVLSIRRRESAGGLLTRTRPPETVTVPAGIE